MSAVMESHKKIFTLPPSDEGAVGTFKNIGLFIQETSSEHSSRMGISITALQAANLTWVLARQQFLLLQMPKPGEKVEIETWPSSLGKILCLREFTIRNEEGETLGHSLTDWAVVNMQTRKAERIPEFICHKYPSKSNFAMPELNLKPSALPSEDRRKIFTAQHEDIDINNHVTSTRYVDFMLDTARDVTDAGSRPLFLDIIYRAESLEGDRIESRIAPAEMDDVKELDNNFTALLPSGPICAYWHNLVKMKKKLLFITKEGEKELVRGFSLWLKE